MSNETLDNVKKEVKIATIALAALKKQTQAAAAALNVSKTQLEELESKKGVVLVAIDAAHKNIEDLKQALIRKKEELRQLDASTVEARYNLVDLQAKANVKKKDLRAELDILEEAFDKKRSRLHTLIVDKENEMMKKIKLASVAQEKLLVFSTKIKEVEEEQRAIEKKIAKAKIDLGETFEMKDKVRESVIERQKKADSLQKEVEKLTANTLAIKARNKELTAENTSIALESKRCREERDAIVKEIDEMLKKREKAQKAMLKMLEKEENFKVLPLDIVSLLELKCGPDETVRTHRAASSPGTPRYYIAKKV